MPTYVYEAMNQSGQTVKEEVDAPTSEEALAKIRSLGYFPTRIREKGGKKKTGRAAGKKRKTSLSIGGVSTKMITQFTRQLSTLQDAGLPILRSLRILEEQQKPGLLKNILANVSDEVEGGATLSEAMSRSPKAFNKLYVNMIAAGETGGVLDLILQRLADFMEKAANLKRKVVGALIYPIAVISFSGAIVVGIMVVVVPKFQEIFKDFGTELPPITQVLIGTSQFFSKGTATVPIPGWIIVLATPFALIAISKLIHQSKAGCYVWDSMMMRLPVFGMIIRKSTIARFTRTLGTLINAGVPILEAINITRDTSGNEVYARALNKVHDSIREGESFAGPLRAAKVCDAMVVNMIDVGEETGDLDKMLSKIADNYDDEVDTLVGSLVSLLEPIIVISLGLVVGGIVVALFAPLVTLIQSVTGG